jgi:hypothetical protein
LILFLCYSSFSFSFTLPLEPEYLRFTEIWNCKQTSEHSGHTESPEKTFFLVLCSVSRKTDFSVCFLSGKGPEKELYERKIRSMNLIRCKVITLWLEAKDYPRLLGEALSALCKINRCCRHRIRCKKYLTRDRHFSPSKSSPCLKRELSVCPFTGALRC